MNTQRERVLAHSFQSVEESALRFARQRRGTPGWVRPASVFSGTGYFLNEKKRSCFHLGMEASSAMTMQAPTMASTGNLSMMG